MPPAQLQKYAAVRKEAAQLLSRAAGIFDYLATSVLPEYEQVGDEKRLPETRIAGVQAMSLMCLLNIQELNIQNALDKCSSPSLIAKLCAGASLKANEARQVLGAGLGPQFHQLDLSWNLYFKAKWELFEAISKEHSAKALWASGNRGDYGAALGYTASAKKIVSTLFASESVRLTELAAQIARHKIFITSLHKQYTEDNNKIYFESIPPEGIGVCPLRVFFSVNCIFSTSLSVSLLNRKPLSAGTAHVHC